MYDEQIKLKVDRPWSRFVKESISLSLVPHAEVVKRLQNSYLFMLIFRWRNSAVLCSLRRQWPDGPFPIEIVLSLLRLLCWLWRILMTWRVWIHFGIICSLQWCVGWRWSLQVFVFSLTVAVSVTEASEPPYVGCLKFNVENWSITLSVRVVLFALHVCHNVITV